MVMVMVMVIIVIKYDDREFRARPGEGGTWTRYVCMESSDTRIPGLIIRMILMMLLLMMTMTVITLVHME